ncbi:MAG: Ig-like domain-containing protein [Candidatus Zixiibacteriota bacterium]
MVTKVYPSASDGPVPIDSRIEIHFSKSIDTSSFNGFALEFDTDIPGTFVFADSIVYYEPDSLLAINSNYTVNLASWVKDREGTKLDSNLVWTFTTNQGAGYYWHVSQNTCTSYYADLCWGNNQFSIVGGNWYPSRTGFHMSSVDGKLWTTLLDTTILFCSGAYWNDILFMGGFSDTIYYSLTGSSLYPIHYNTGFFSDLIRSFYSNDSLLVLVENSIVNDIYTSEVWKSFGGDSWEGGYKFHYTLTDITWNGNTFIVIGYPDLVLTSSDGLESWTEQRISSGTTAILSSIVSSDDLTIAVSENTSSIFATQNGQTWNEIDLASQIDSTLTLNDIIWTGHEYLAVGRVEDYSPIKGTGIVISSKDGAHWIKRFEYTDSSNDFLFRKIAYSGHSFVILSNNTPGRIFYSP